MTAGVAKPIVESWMSFLDHFEIPPLPVESFIVMDLKNLKEIASVMSTVTLTEDRGAGGEKWRDEHIGAVWGLELAWPLCYLHRHGKYVNWVKVGMASA